MPHESESADSELMMSTLAQPTGQAWRHLRVKYKVFNEDDYEVWPPKPREHKPGEPEIPEIHLADVACVGPTMLNSLYWLFGRPITFALLTTNLPLLVAIRPSVTSLITAGIAVHAGAMAWWFPLVVALPVRFFDDPFVYWAGRRYGDRLTSYLIQTNPRLEKTLARGERVMERWGFWAILGANTVIPLPAPALYIIAGDTRMPIKTFVAADLLGLEIYAAAMVALGYALGKAGEGVVTTIGQYSTYLFWASVALLAVYMVTSVRRSMRMLREQEARREQATARHDDD